ncbi:sulfur carrier protein ThiS [Acinetobacter larvae]|uniref:Thiamine biosynthesis protein ThiS n=1 Tax=Acinetobacter larvae TaxID=1789224 RepID=A0A1B2LZZ6_9GAMM|nr:sulfur carrier protein ThiS [Acinetobacter larvae]AOA58491.1 thiamine biosynthesis protein ThiS [Acinetobacter larvae]
MQIYLNGALQTCDANNLNQLIQQLDLEGKRFAVELNQNIIPKSQLQQTAISEHDRIEIIHAVGGG